MLEGQFYQLGFVCDNLEEAIESFRGRGMTHEPHIMEVEQPVDTPGGEVVNKMRLCFIWIGDLQYELIQPIEDPLGVYANAPANGGPIRFHQVCFRIKDWADFRARVDQQDLPVVMERETGVDKVQFLSFGGGENFAHYPDYPWMPAAAGDRSRGR